ncbi:unnamed protein product [Nyctereutes procyonoides]|uniref:(raccoon dog) hypothetical protein n=1 Tax=Nyctereutes procyonoides TaxID=34880 RepID=A0A811YWC0_NYCPR|nr:unnamed protein product [Nyctereutes procyonoides]
MIKNLLKEEVSSEERFYEGGRFATGDMTDKPVSEDLWEAMPKVMKYVGGTNDKGIRMGMTFQSNSLVPTNNSIKTVDRESITIHSFAHHPFTPTPHPPPPPPPLVHFPELEVFIFFKYFVLILCIGCCRPECPTLKSKCILLHMLRNSHQMICNDPTEILFPVL